VCIVQASSDVTFFCRLWALSDGSSFGQCISTLNSHTQAVYSVAYSPSGTTFASGSKDKSVTKAKGSSKAKSGGKVAKKKTSVKKASSHESKKKHKAAAKPKATAFKSKARRGHEKKN
jgi:WD40 repeat protein